jgi:hypothetical protein
VYKTRSFLAERPLTPQEELCSMESVYCPLLRQYGKADVARLFFTSDDAPLFQGTALNDTGLCILARFDTYFSGRGTQVSVAVTLILDVCPC